MQLRKLQRAKLGLGKSNSTRVYRSKSGATRFQGNGRLLKATQVYPKNFGKSVSLSVCKYTFSCLPPPTPKIYLIYLQGSKHSYDRRPAVFSHGTLIIISYVGPASLTKVCRNHLLYADAPLMDLKLNNTMDPWDDAKPLGLPQ